jgi:hypothetical protein
VPTRMPRKGRTASHLILAMVVSCRETVAAR